MRQTSILLLHSKDRVNGTSSNFTLQLPEAITDVKSIELLSSSIPSTVYNIDSTNNKFYFIDGGVDKTVTLSSGSYTSSTLATTLQTGINAVGVNVYTVTYNDTTFKLGITATGNFSLRFGTFQTNSVASLLGFSTADTVLGTSVTAPNALDLAEPDYYMIEISEFFQNVRSSKNDVGTFIIPCVNITDGTSEIFYKNSSYNHIELYQNCNISSLTIKLKTHNNKIIDLNGSEWYFLIRLHY